MNSNSFVMWLYDETRRYATELDGHVTALTKPGVTLSQYRSFLVRTLGFEGPLESALAYTAGLKLVCELRNRSGLVVRDLLALGMTPHDVTCLPQCAIAPFSDLAAALGWLYVLERSRLQHPLLCAHLANVLPQAHEASDYFCRDDLTITKRWMQVTSALEQFVETNADAAQRMRTGAIDAFETALDWYRDEPMRVAQ